MTPREAIPLPAPTISWWAVPFLDAPNPAQVRSKLSMSWRLTQQMAWRFEGTVPSGTRVQVSAEAAQFALIAF